MNTNPMREPVESQNASLDLEGLEGLLDQPHLEVVQPEAPTEAQVILELLSLLVEANDIVKETGERLNIANERLNEVASMAEIHTRQMEMLAYYQNEAARAASLQNQLEIATAELMYLRRPLLKKLMFWTK